MLNITKSKKILTFSLVIIIMIMSLPIFSAFEAHIVNVTATIKDNTPVANPSGGTYSEPIEVSLSTCEPGATILYTTDNTNPSCPSNGNEYNEYIGFIPITEDTILKAVACGLRGSRSGLMEEIYTITGAYSGNGNTVALWHFSEGSETTANDSSGNNNHGTIYGADWVDGKYDGALEFNDEDDYVEVPDSDSLDITDQITIEAWINPDSMDDYESFVHKDNAYVLQFAPGSDGYLRGALWLSGLTILDDTTTQLSIGEWHHVALTYNGSAMKLYVNEIEVASKNVTGNIVANSNPLYIGYNPRDPTNPDHWWYDGIIDEVRISNIARY